MLLYKTYNKLETNMVANYIPDHISYVINSKHISISSKPWLAIYYQTRKGDFYGDIKIYATGKQSFSKIYLSKFLFKTMKRLYKKYVK